MMARSGVVAGSIALLMAVSPTVPGAEWATDDGLVIALNDDTGAVERIRVGAGELPLVDGVPGGLSVQEFVRDPSETGQAALAQGFESHEPSWTSAVMADWDADDVFASRRTDGAFEGEGYLRVGDGKTPGAGMAAKEPVALAPGEICTISWRGRSADIAQNCILCLRLFGEDGEDVTATATPPAGWQHTPYSNAHYRVDIRNRLPDTWEPFSYEYVAPERVASAGLSLRVFRGGTLEGDIDDLRVTVLPAPWLPARPVAGRITGGPDGLTQRAELVDEGLRFVTEYEGHEEYLSATVRVEATDAARAQRCLRVRYALPLALAGWTWSAGPREEAVIEPGRTYEDAISLAGHPLSRYPLGSVCRRPVGLAMATPLGKPAIQSFHGGPGGLVTAVEFGLTPEAPNAGAGFTFVVYRHDPRWGFRAALERYYAIFPQPSEGEARRGGIWTLRLPDATMRAPEDFGLAFYECGAAGEQERAFCRAHDIAMLRYIEPWGARQTFPEAESRGDMPPYEDRLTQVRGWARESASDDLWLGVPRHLMARVVLNSVLLGPDGIAAYQVDKYSHWAQWWQLNTDPDLASPNRAEVTMAGAVEPAVAWADGIYVDSVSLSRAVSEDHDARHFAAADYPLAFSVKTGTPVVLSGLAHYEFLEHLRGYLRERGKLLMLNLFPPATRLYGHLADIAGCELSGPQDDSSAMQQRIYAYHRPLSNLLQWRFSVLERVPAMTPEQMEEYFHNQLFYGFWPGISTAGGGTEAGYAHMHRYFRAPELYERDRALFRQFMPRFDELNRAGWEPVPHARADSPEVWVERFGGGPEVGCLTVHNASDETREAAVTLERGWWVDALSAREGISVTEAVSGSACEVTARGDALSCRVRLGSKRTAVLRVERAPNR